MYRYVMRKKYWQANILKLKWWTCRKSNALELFETRDKCNHQRHNLMTNMMAWVMLLNHKNAARRSLMTLFAYGRSDGMIVNFIIVYQVFKLELNRLLLYCTFSVSLPPKGYIHVLLKHRIEKKRIRKPIKTIAPIASNWFIFWIMFI